MRRGHLTFAAICLVVAGCSGGARADVGSGIDVPEPTAEAKAIIFPFDSYELSDNDINETYVASDALIRPCMRERGHEWGQIKTPENVPSWRNRLHFGVVELSVATRFGYHAPAELLSSPGYRGVTKQIRGRLASMPKGATSDVVACQKEADRTLTRGAKTSFAKFNDLKSSTFDAAKRDEHVRNVVSRWSACMKTAGFDYATPWGAASKWGAKGDPTKREISTAEADVKCKRQVDVVTVWLAAEKRLQEIEIGKNRPYFDEIRKVNRRYMSNARAVLSQK